MIYPDTSVLIASVANEPLTHAARAMLAEHATRLATSDWVRAELASAIAQKVRTQNFTPAGARTATLVLRRMLAASFRTLPMSDVHFSLCAQFIERDVAPLKAPDALHLAVASQAGATIWTGDRPMATAAEALGLDVVLLKMS